MAQEKLQNVSNISCKLRTNLIDKSHCNLLLRFTEQLRMANERWKIISSDSDFVHIWHLSQN